MFAFTSLLGISEAAPEAKSSGLQMFRDARYTVAAKISEMESWAHANSAWIISL